MSPPRCSKVLPTVEERFRSKTVYKKEKNEYKIIIRFNVSHKDMPNQGMLGKTNMSL